MGTMKAVEKIFLLGINLIFFFVLSLLFLPSFLIVTYLQPLWAKMLGELFAL